ncbi:hypothetical protein FIBSPDRAFT_185950 [Athelia psychrophila]|uniref:Uncharacterized protein n=1 Tax=Athelia psychrophila TaxID=1759441 RepID=A0A166AAP2_9AGAM|nr:hypothetical protein FIBSPDRAFT_185950 [Fibularhizoctonia sp. CBS 109695]
MSTASAQLSSVMLAPHLLGRVELSLLGKRQKQRPTLRGIRSSGNAISHRWASNPSLRLHNKSTHNPVTNSTPL